MLKEIDNHLSDIKKISIKSSDELEEFRIKYISKKGIVTGLFSRLKDVDSDKRKKFGFKINELKIKVHFDHSVMYLSIKILFLHSETER